MSSIVEAIKTIGEHAELFEAMVERFADDGTRVFVTEMPLPNGYQFKDGNGNIINATKIVLEKKKKEYPKTYEECCEVLGIDDHEIVAKIDFQSTRMKCNDWKRFGKVEVLYKLIVCRDAYWKLYGEEMGLEKPWSPSDNKEPIHVITRYDGYIIKYESDGNNEVLEFPTEEMRNAFYENFKSEIEQCKELL